MNLAKAWSHSTEEAMMRTRSISKTYEDPYFEAQPRYGALEDVATMCRIVFRKPQICSSNLIEELARNFLSLLQITSEFCQAFIGRFERARTRQSTSFPVKYAQAIAGEIK